MIDGDHCMYYVVFMFCPVADMHSLKFGMWILLNLDPFHMCSETLVEAGLEIMVCT